MSNFDIGGIDRYIPESKWSEFVYYIPGVGDIASKINSWSLDSQAALRLREKRDSREFQDFHQRKVETISMKRNRYHLIDGVRWLITAGIIALLGYFLLSSLALFIAGVHFYHYDPQSPQFHSLPFSNVSSQKSSKGDEKEARIHIDVEE